MSVKSVKQAQKSHSPILK